MTWPGRKIWGFTMTVNVMALVSVNEDDPFALGEYFRVTGPLMDRVGAKIVKRFRINEVGSACRPAKTVMIVNYPDRAAVDSVFESAEYRAIKPMRDRAFLDYHVSVASDEGSDQRPANVVELH